jgi:hypothetical protein
MGDIQAPHARCPCKKGSCTFAARGAARGGRGGDLELQLQLAWHNLEAAQVRPAIAQRTRPASLPSPWAPFLASRQHMTSGCPSSLNSLLAASSAAGSVRLPSEGASLAARQHKALQLGVGTASRRVRGPCSGRQHDRAHLGSALWAELPLSPRLYPCLAASQPPHVHALHRRMGLPWIASCVPVLA